MMAVVDSFANSDVMMQFNNVIGNETEYVELRSVLTDGGDHFGVSSVCFDLQEELLWVGNQGGHVTSYYGPEMVKYTSFQVHPTNDVRQLFSLETGILILTRNALRFQSRQGLSLFNHSAETLEDMQCMMLKSHTSLLMGGHQPNLIELDLSTLEEIRQVNIGSSGCAILRECPKYVCAGDTNGKIRLCDPQTLNVEHTLEAHSGTLSDFDIGGNHLVTCGFSNRKGKLSVDRFLMVYDLRMMRALTPVQVMLEPLLLRFVPAFTSQFAVVSQTGQFQLVETGAIAQSSRNISQVNSGGSMCLSFDVSSSCKAMAFGDANGGVHLFALGNQTGQFFNRYSHPTEFSEVVDLPFMIDINDYIPSLASIPMSYCSGKLLSDWPSESCKAVYRHPLPIDANILQSMKMVQSIGYAPNPGTRLRNQVPYKINQKKNRSSVVVSESLREDASVVVPKRYQKSEIKCYKSGADDSESHMMNSSFSGLEHTVPLSYCNVMLQVLYFIKPLRASLLSHLCAKEFCLSCELGFLFYMLDVSKGMPCQANNFLRAFRTIPEAAALGLILNNVDDAYKKANLKLLIQNWTRFILQQIHAETSQAHDSESKDQLNEKSELFTKSVVSDIFYAEMSGENTCKCGHFQRKSMFTSVVSLVYPDCFCEPLKKCVQYTFADVLKRSLCLEQVTQAWCDNCEKYQPTVQNRRVKSLPDVFVVNCGLNNKTESDFWKIQTEMSKEKVSQSSSAGGDSISQKLCRYGAMCNREVCKFRHDFDDGNSVDKQYSAEAISWLPLNIWVKLLEEGDVNIIDNYNTEKESNDDSHDGYISYELIAAVNNIKDCRSHDDQNLVGFIRVSSDDLSSDWEEDKWYLFNDVVVMPVSVDEVLSFDSDWKLPCVLYFARKDISQRHSYDVKNPITRDVFLEDKSLVTREGRKRITFTPLGADEVLHPGDIVAMDAEFVSLNQEESELRSDGTRSTIKPSQMSVARITCIRGHGLLKGVPFIDDYISTQEQVVDYLTKFSGIMPGDLDATLSSKHLTTLKSTYLKLRFLIDTGVKFVGHGLKTDFRVINLVVPTEQVIDTVYLFHQSHQRMVSLRFLAWHFLGLKIQSVTHDSIEDARTALRLYEKYRNLENDGRVSDALKQLYESGRNLQWKVPDTKC